MKKMIAVFLSIAIMLACAACGGQKDSEEIMQLFLYGNMEGMTDKKDVRSVEASFTLGRRTVNTFATIKVQGSSSLAYEKKNYTIKFFKDESHEVKKLVDVGWGKQNEYCLKANWIDKTHSRNIVTARLAAEIQKKYGVMEQAPNNGLIDGFPVEVYINDQYHGLYTWNIPKSAWQFGMEKDNPNHIVMCGENWEPAALFYELPNLDSWSVEAGPENEETLAKFSRLADFIMNSSDEEFKEHFAEYIDMDAMLNYFVLAELANLHDNFGKNMLIATYDGNIWYPSLYDLDTSWGTWWDGSQLYDYQNELACFSSVNNLAARVQTLFAQELHDRYFELRKDILTKEHILELFNEFDAGIPADAKVREAERWGENIPGYDLTQVEEYLDSVIERLDEKYANLVS